jgi:hypothetical protein
MIQYILSECSNPLSWAEPYELVFCSTLSWTDGLPAGNILLGFGPISYNLCLLKTAQPQLFTCIAQRTTRPYIRETIIIATIFLNPYYGPDAILTFSNDSSLALEALG